MLVPNDIIEEYVGVSGHGSGFSSSACQNPSLTIMALTVRSTDYLLGALKRGNL